MKGYQANSRLYWLVACHSLMICTGFGHIQVECDFGSVPSYFFSQLNSFQKVVGSAKHLDPIPVWN